MQRTAALARLEVEELQAELAASREGHDPSELAEAIARITALLASVSMIAERMSRTLDVPVGLSIEQTAERLQVAAPTVRKWLREGFLQPVEGRTPREVDPKSVVVVERALRAVKDNFPAQRWTEALAAYLHDQHLQQSNAFRRAVDEAQRGELIEI